SNFDRPPPNLTDWEHLTRVDQNGFLIAIDNVYNAGIEIVKGIIANWTCTYSQGIKPSNYVGDIFGSLGGQPDFGFGSLTGGKRVEPGGGGDMRLAAVEMDRRERFVEQTKLVTPLILMPSSAQHIPALSNPQDDTMESEQQDSQSNMTPYLRIASLH
ncbi:hypothetical protein E4U21_002262, partial [Claviceps maximensis]